MEPKVHIHAGVLRLAEVEDPKAPTPQGQACYGAMLAERRSYVLQQLARLRSRPNGGTRSKLPGCGRAVTDTNALRFVINP